MAINELMLSGLKLLSPTIYRDKRGFFCETLRKSHLLQAGISCEFVQENHSFSHKGVLRGMHFQKGQAKLIQVIVGTIFDVAVDIRPSSPSFGKWFSIYLRDENPQLFFIPDGFAHGFCVMSPIAHLIYKVSEYYDPKKEKQFSALDSELAIPWPISDILQSERDISAPNFSKSLCESGL